MVGGRLVHRSRHDCPHATSAVMSQCMLAHAQQRSHIAIWSSAGPHALSAVTSHAPPVAPDMHDVAEAHYRPTTPHALLVTPMLRDRWPSFGLPSGAKLSSTPEQCNWSFAKPRLGCAPSCALWATCGTSVVLGDVRSVGVRIVVSSQLAAAQDLQHICSG